MMSFDNIDLDSWRKAPVEEPRQSPAVEPSVERQPARRKDQHRERAVSRSPRHVTPYVLKEAILASRLNMGGRLTLQGIVKRNKADDVSIPAFILEVLQQLKEEGYEP